MLNNGIFVMQGDSVTDADKKRPQDLTPNSHGFGYVAFVNALIKAQRPELRVDVYNSGISGDTTRDNKKRWQADVIDLKPDYFSLLIGVNDVWRKHDGNLDLAVPIDEYEKNLAYFISVTKPVVKKFAILTPFFLTTDLNDPMRRDVDDFAAVVRRLAAKHGLILVDVAKEFDERMKTVDYSEFAYDRVHPTHVGHMIMAKAVLKEMFGM